MFVFGKSNSYCWRSVCVASIASLVLLQGCLGSSSSSNDNDSQQNELDADLLQPIWQNLSSSEAPYRFKAIHFLDEQRGWAVGSQSLVRTTNGGLTWQAFDGGNTYTDASFQDVHFVNETDGWAVGLSIGGSRNLMARTDDGGVTWTRVEDIPGSEAYTSVFFLDEQTGWIHGREGVIWKTENGGDTWSEKNSGTSEGFKAAVFVDENRGWAVGRAGMIRRTEDGGETWDSQDSGVSRTLYDIAVLDEDTAWAVGYYGTIVTTIDGGQTWTSRDSGVTESLRAVAFSDSETIWAAGHAGVILFSDDAGSTWHPAESNTEETLYTIQFLNPGLGRAGGFGGTYLEYDEDAQGGDGGATAPGGWTKESLTYNSNGNEFDLNDTLSRIAITGADTAIATTLSGNIIRTTDGAETWYRVEPNVDPGEIHGLDFLDANHGWAVGYTFEDGDGRVLRTTDGGANWQEARGMLDGVVDNRFRSVAFRDQNTGFAVSPSHLWKSVDGGASWSKEQDLESTTFDIQFLEDGLHGWIVGHAFAGDQFFVFRTTDGGSNWTQTSDTVPHGDGSRTLRRVHFHDSTHGWAVGADGVLMHSSDGGVTWSRQESGVDVDLWGIHAESRERVWVTGQWGTVLLTEDGGLNWNQIDFDVYTQFNAIDMLPSGEFGLMGGSGGTYFRYRP